MKYIYNIKGILQLLAFWGFVLCFDLFCFALLCFALLCFVLLFCFCFILLCFVFVFCFVLFCFVLFCFVLFGWFGLVWFGLFWFGLVWFVLVLLQFALLCFALLCFALVCFGLFLVLFCCLLCKGIKNSQIKYKLSTLNVLKLCLWRHFTRFWKSTIVFKKHSIVSILIIYWWRLSLRETDPAAEHAGLSGW